jgi:hypothetical protein
MQIQKSISGIFMLVCHQSSEHRICKNEQKAKFRSDYLTATKKYSHKEFHLNVESLVPNYLLILYTFS